VIVPTVLLPPATPLTLQFTPVPAAPLTMVAAKLMIPPVPSVNGLVLGLVIATETLVAPVTVNNAGVVVEVVIEFVKTASYKFPDCANAAAKLSVVEVAPATAVNVVPPFVLTNHCTVGAGFPVAAAVNVAVSVAPIVRFTGFSVTVGAKSTVSVAAVVVPVPPAFVNTASYLLPFCEAVVVKLKVVEVAPETAMNDVPPFVLTIHCTVGVGVPVAAAVNVAVFPAVTVVAVGLVVMTIELTVSVAAVVVTLPTEFVNTASYRLAFCAAVVVKLKDAEVAPATAV